MVRWTVWDRLIAKIRFSQIKGLIREGDTVCDIGCGFDGGFLKSMSKKICRGYGFDRKVSDERFSNIELISTDLQEKLSLGDCSVGVVTMLAVLEHLDSPGYVLRQAYRVLAPGGRIVLTTPSPRAKPVLEFMAFRLKIISAEEISDHKHYFTSIEIRSLLGEIGFKDIMVNKFTFGLNQMATAVKPRE